MDGVKCKKWTINAKCCNQHSLNLLRHLQKVLIVILKQSGLNRLQGKSPSKNISRQSFFEGMKLKKDFYSSAKNAKIVRKIRGC